MTNENYGVSVVDFGATGGGKNDDAAAFQAALDSGAELVTVPFGEYLISRPLKIGSNTRLKAHKRALIRLADGACTGPDDFLLANKNIESGDSHIVIEGGIWDYNNPGNPRHPELFDQSGATGMMIRFKNVRDLTLSGMTLRDPECYYLCFCQAEDFLVENISFESFHIRPNQDGVHLAGFCKNGVIRNLHAAPESPNDDYVAINADDCLTRLQNTGLLNGPIENITVSGLETKVCHSFVRMASFTSLIKNIEIDGLTGGCKAFVINMDAARYCRTPLFKDEDYPEGVGNVENVRISNVNTHAVGSCKGLFCLETNVKNFRVRNFRYDFENAGFPHSPAVFIGNLRKSDVRFGGVSSAQAKKSLDESTCKTLSAQPSADPYRDDAAELKAEIAPGEKIILSAGDFDSLMIN